MTKEIKNGVNPDNAIPPGETLQEYLDSVGMKQVDLSKRTGLAAKTLNEIIKGKAPITPETALKLECVFGTPASFWNNLEANYQETRARLEAEKEIDQDIPIAALVPYAELANRGFVKPTKKPREKVHYLRQFFGVASLKFIPEIMPVAFRKKTKDSSSHYALASWIRMGELMAAEIETQPFSEKRLKETMPAFRALTLQDDGTWSVQLEDLCASCGVAMVIIPHLPKTLAHGATEWLQPGKAMVQLSTRYESADIFWFSLFHELGHILLHSKKAVFAETNEKTSEEAEADHFASECLIPGSKYRAFLKKKRLNRDAIMIFAHKIGIDPGVVVGRMHHDKILDWSDYQDLQRQVN